MAKGGNHGHNAQPLAAIVDTDQHLVGGNPDELMVGGGGNDFLYGCGGNDTLIGGDGNDILWGAFGVDRMTGGAGADVFKFDAWQETATGIVGPGDIFLGYTSTPDTITDFEPGVDKILIDFMFGVAGDRSAVITDNGDGSFDTAFHFENDWTSFTGHVTTLGTAPLLTDIVWA